MSSKWDEFIETDNSSKWDEFIEQPEQSTKEGLGEGAIEGVKGFVRTGLKMGTALVSAPSKSIGGFLQLFSKIGTEGRPGTEMIKKAGQYFSKLGTENQQFLNQKISNILGDPYGSFEEKLTKYGENIASLYGSYPAAGLMKPAIVGGALGQTAEEIGLPPIVKTIAEIAPLAFRSFSKELVAKGQNKQAIEWAREMGLTETEIAPLIQSERKQKWLSKIASKGEKTQEKLRASQKSLGRVYGNLRKMTDANIPMNEQQLGSFMKEIMPIIEDLPANMRDAIAKDAADLARNGFTGSELINFYQDINASGIERLGVLKEPIQNALNKISPQLGQNFQMTNQLYSKYATIAKRLKPNLGDTLISKSQALRQLYGVLTGNIPLLLETTAEHRITLLARDMLLNPKYQNISKKIINSLNQNKFSIANQLKNKLANEIKEVDPELAEELKIIDLNELKK